MGFPRLGFAALAASALLAACERNTAPDSPFPTKGVEIVVDSAIYHLQRRGSLGFRVNIAVTVINDGDHDVFLSQQCGYYSLTRTQSGNLELGAYACAAVGGNSNPTPIRIGAGTRFTKIFDLLGSIQPQARPQITLEDNIGEVKFRFGFTNETGTASKSLETAPFTVLPPDPNASVELDLHDQFIFTGAAEDKGEIFAMGMSSGEAIRVSPDSLGADCPVVSHDGRRILFVGNSDVWVMKADGSEMRRVMPRPSDDAWFHRCPSWSPDDKSFVWVTMVPMVKQPSPGAVYLVDVETGAATTLMTGSNFSSADWSPDGQHILVGANEYTDGGPYDFSVSVLRLDGTKVSQVAARTWGASWAPDGASFGYLCGESVPSLCVADTTGANVRLVTDSVYSKPYWSPDGGRIAFIGNGGVYLVSVDGRARRMLYPVKPSFDITWSPDARRIAWACGGGSNGNDICRIGADGTGFFRMQTTVSAAQITWPPLM